MPSHFNVHFPINNWIFQSPQILPYPPKTNSNSIQLLQLQLSLHRAKVRRWFLDLYQILSPDHAGAAWRVCACSGVCAFQRLSIRIVIETSKDTHVNERRGGGGGTLECIRRRGLSDDAECAVASLERWRHPAEALLPPRACNERCCVRLKSRAHRF